MPKQARKALDEAASGLTKPGVKVYASDIVREALTDWFRARGEVVDFSVDRGGKRESKPD